ncbi:MAG: hypothetical protein Q8Q38_03375 [bacterium]|nr:hypothetical protein [bacterium]MDZ4232100.1 hypothetical protein [Candidatus Pacearchaeota archaeon]
MALLQEELELACGEKQRVCFQGRVVGTLFAVHTSADSVLGALVVTRSRVTRSGLEAFTAWFPAAELSLAEPQ